MRCERKNRVPFGSSVSDLVAGTLRIASPAPEPSGKSWISPMRNNPINGICKLLGENIRPFTRHASTSHIKMIATQQIVTMIQVALSTPPNKTVVDTGIKHSRKKITELRRDEWLPIATFSIMLGF